MSPTHSRSRLSLTSAFVALLCLFAWSAPALACPACGKHRGKDPMKKIERHADEIGLQDQQLAEMRGLVEAGVPARSVLDEEIRSSRDRLHELMQADTPDESLIIDQVEALGALNTRRDVERFRTKLELRSLMTTDQIAKMRELRGEHRGECRAGKEGSCGQCSGDPASCPHRAAHAAKTGGGEQAYECPRAKAAREAASAQEG
jgi:Spy/CpxP family protein refolding chaperone